MLSNWRRKSRLQPRAPPPAPHNGELRIIAHIDRLAIQQDLKSLTTGAHHGCTLAISCAIHTGSGQLPHSITQPLG